MHISNVIRHLTELNHLSLQNCGLTGQFIELDEDHEDAGDDMVGAQQQSGIVVGGSPVPDPQGLKALLQAVSELDVTPRSPFTLKLKGFLSYDEMQLSALMSVCSQTSFLNNGQG